MRNITTIILLLFCQNSFGQIKLGIYSQLRNSFPADLELYADKKFDFYDTRDDNSWRWKHTIGKWKLNKDTIIFTWQKSTLTESLDSIISSTDLKNNNVQIKFVYDDGRPIANVKTSLDYNFYNSTKTYLTDSNGIVIIPQKLLDSSDKRKLEFQNRWLCYDVENEIIKLSFKISIDSLYDSLANVFTIIIKKKPKSYIQIMTKKYLHKNDTLLEVNRKEFNDYNWGDFKFFTKKYGR